VQQAAADLHVRRRAELIDDAERVHELLCELIDDANSQRRMQRVSALFGRIVELVHESKLKA